MAQDITLLGASYSAVPAVVLPKTGGGSASFTDVTDTTAAAEDVASGKYFYSASGERTEGTASGGGGGFSADDIAQNLAPNGSIVLGSAVTEIKQRAFIGKPIANLTGANVTKINSECFRYCTSITELHLPSLTSNMVAYAVAGCNNLELADLGGTGWFEVLSLDGCNKLRTLILRRSSVAGLANLNALQNTPFRGYNGLTGTVYVPSSLISSYKTASNWSTVYGAGTCSFVALEGSIYE